MAWLGGCSTNVVELHQSKRYEPISCSPNGFTLYNVDGFMWEYEVDTLGWTAFASPKDFSKEWAADSSAERPAHIQHFSNGAHYVYSSRIVTVQGDTRTEHPLPGATHANDLFQLQDGVVSVHSTSIADLKIGDELTRVFTFCQFNSSNCETRLWPAFIDVVGSLSAPKLLTQKYFAEPYREFFKEASEADPTANYRLSVFPRYLSEWTFSASTFTQGRNIAFGVSKEVEAGLLVTTDTLHPSRYIRLVEITYDPTGECREANSFPWGLGNESCMYTPKPEVSRVCMLDDGGIIAQVRGEQQYWIFLVR